MQRLYTAEEKEKLESNSYTLKVSASKFYPSVKFKEDFWVRYQAGISPRKIIKDFGYDLELFTQKQIDGIVQKIKKQADANQPTLFFLKINDTLHHIIQFIDVILTRASGGNRTLK